MNSYEKCENCGSRVYGGMCTWCDEEYFIDEQRRRNEEEQTRRNEEEENECEGE